MHKQNGEREEAVVHTQLLTDIAAAHHTNGCTTETAEEVACEEFLLPSQKEEKEAP